MHRGALQCSATISPTCFSWSGSPPAAPARRITRSIPANATPSRAFGIWNPGPNDTCTKEQHDAYSVVGPDGKLYPTWHPPTGPGGCTFGHEHGRDPHGSSSVRRHRRASVRYGQRGARDHRSRQSARRRPLRSQGRVGKRHGAAVLRSRLGDLQRQVRRPDQAPPGNALEGCVHEQPARAGLPHSLQRRDRDAHHDADGHRHAG